MTSISDKQLRADHIAKQFEIPLLFMALLVIPTIIIEQSHPSQMWSTIAGLLNWTIWLAFFTELAVMLYVVPNKWRWIRSHPLEIAIVVLTPPFMPASLQSARAIRLLRLTRLLRAHKIMKRLFTFQGLEYAAFVTLFVVLLGGAAFAIVEKDQNLNLWDGTYWALTTVSTLGSDISPQTTEGRIISLSVLFIGTGFIAMLTAAFAQRFIINQKRQEQIENESAAITKKLDQVLDRLSKIDKK